MTAAIAPASDQAPPELTRIAMYPMRSQPRPLRVTYVTPCDAFAVAALSNALAAAVADGVGLALRLDAERLAVGAAAEFAGDGTGEGADAAVVAAVSAHCRSCE